MNSSVVFAVVLALFGFGAVALLFWLQDRRGLQADLRSQENDEISQASPPVRRYLEVTTVRQTRVSVSPLVVLLLIGILLAVTNPSQSDFADYLHRQVAAQSNTYDALTMGLSKLVTGGFASLAERRDFAVFSVYKVRMDRDHEYYWRGIAKQFMPWPVNCVFRTKPNTQSGANRTRVSDQTVQRFAGNRTPISWLRRRRTATTRGLAARRESLTDIRSGGVLGPWPTGGCQCARSRKHYVFAGI